MCLDPPLDGLDVLEVTAPAVLETLDLLASADEVLAFDDDSLLEVIEASILEPEAPAVATPDCTAVVFVAKGPAIDICGAVPPETGPTGKPG